VIGPVEARVAARHELHGAPVRIDPQFAVFADALLGEPLLVHDVAKEPSYWLVPVVLRGKVVGSIRVSATGRVAAIASYCRDAASLAHCPKVVTRISADEAERRAASRVDVASGEIASPPLYVHDGSPGREAWLVETAALGRPSRRIFVTASGMYERPVP
jgi:hypothetical protein